MQESQIQAPVVLVPASYPRQAMHAVYRVYDKGSA